MRVFPIVVPPLREPREDVAPLAESFLARLAREEQKPLSGFHPEALALMERYPWPGNVRASWRTSTSPRSSAPSRANGLRRGSPQTWSTARAGCRSCLAGVGVEIRAAALTPCARLGYAAVAMSDDVPDDLPLFRGPHVPRIRCERALERLDLAAAAADAPDEQWRRALISLVRAMDPTGRVCDTALDRLTACDRTGWPGPIERAWQRIVGRRLDAHGIPGRLNGEPAAAFLLRGGERDRAHRSLRRDLRRHPRDVTAWQLLVQFEPIRGAVRCAFHGGAVFDDIAPALVDAIVDDGLDRIEGWMLSYAYFGHALDLEEVEAALVAERIHEHPPLPNPGDPHAFAWFLLHAGGRPFGRSSVGVVEAREHLQKISSPAFRRYLRRVQGGGL